MIGMMTGTEHTIHPAIIVALSLLFIFFTTRMKWLSPGGSIAAVVIGNWVLFVVGIEWLLPLFFFFLSSTLIGRSTRHLRHISDRKHGRARDAVQVICNGGIYALAAAFPDRSIALIAMSASIAISIADTWASEVGIAFRGNTRDVITWKPVPIGLSGGISIAGTIGALIGSFLIALLCSALIGIREHFWLLVLLITGAGLIGMLLDSILGASLQPRFRNFDGSLSDEPIDRSKKISGVNWISNDVVNLLSNAITTALIVLGLKVFVPFT